jgi:hypothetical protein
MAKSEHGEPADAAPVKHRWRDAASLSPDETEAFTRSRKTLVSSGLALWRPRTSMPVGFWMRHLILRQIVERSRYPHPG